MKRNKLLKQCLICKKEILVKSINYPFCSVNCSNIDLSRWFDEKYTFSEEIDEENINFFQK